MNTVIIYVLGALEIRTCVLTSNYLSNETVEVEI
jgi:hypothetical protein